MSDAVCITNTADLVKYHEGCRLVAYLDTRGVWTIGYGQTGPDIVEGLVWTQDQADAVFERAIALAEVRAEIDLGHDDWAALDEVRQAVLTDLAYELGGAGLAEFVNMLSAVRCGNWPMAEYQLRLSKLADEVPNRVNMDAAMLITGAWPQIS